MMARVMARNLSDDRMTLSSLMIRRLYGVVVNYNTKQFASLLAGDGKPAAFRAAILQRVKMTGPDPAPSETHP
jgi:hypothetical protein